MEHSGNTTNTQYLLNNIQEVLINRLNKARQQSSESFSKEIHVLSGINDHDEHQLEQQLQQEREEHTGERIILIPYCSKNSYWVGILIEFEPTEQIVRAEYIDPVNGSDTVPNQLQKQFENVYASAVLQPKTLLKHIDRRLSASLTVKNLLIATGIDHLPDTVNQQVGDSFVIISHENETSICSNKKESLNSSINEENNITSPIHIQQEGNQYKLTELEQKLSDGLQKLKIRDTYMLTQKVQKTEERIKEYEQEERIEDAQKEREYLKELQQLQNLVDDIAQLTYDLSTSKDDRRLKLRQMEEKLGNDLAKLKIRDASMLPQKIQKTEERIKEYEQEERIEDAQKEREYLKELQQLQNLVDDIAKLNYDLSTSNDDRQSKLHQMKEKLSKELEKLKIRDASILPQKIQKTEERIKEYEEEERIDDAQKEREYLKELQQLQNLVNDIAQLTYDLSTSEDNRKLKLHQMEEKLSNELAKLKIRDATILPQKIQKTEERIKEYEDEARIDDAQKEREYLKELQQLQNLVDDIAKLNYDLSTSNEDRQLKLHQMKEKLSNDLTKLKIRDATILPQKLQKTEERIKEYEEEERIVDAQKEREYLQELRQVQNLIDEIAKLTDELSTPTNNDQSTIQQMKEKLNKDLAKLKIRDIDMLSQKIRKTEERIKEYEEEEREDKAEEERKFLCELQELKKLSDEIAELTSHTNDSSLDRKFKHSEPDDISDNNLSQHNLENTTESMSTAVTSQFHMDELIIQKPLSDSSSDPDTIRHNERQKKLLYIDELRKDADPMPFCAGKTILELLAYFELKLLDENIASQNDDFVISSFEKLQDQIKKEELFSENVRAILHDLDMHKTSDNYSVIMRYLNELLKKIRSLNVPEIQRLVLKAEKAAESIRNKDIVLLIGPTGSGKSTTIQFLAGATMKEVQVEISPGKYLQHVTAVGSIKNPELKNVISSPLNRSETRYITPVTIELKEILGPQDTGVMILCDAPGFGDTAGPEVDIANSIGVIEALRGAHSVKILALSSYKSLGDRGQGIQKLAHILISMIHGIEDKLHAIFYVFTKYPENIGINAMLLDIKTSKVDMDITLKSDTVFVTVLMDMIDKTEEAVYTIDPIRDDPKRILRKLKRIQGIQYPGEVFRFSMSEETRGSIDDHVQKDKFSIICALKHKDNDLVLYYLNDLKILKDLIAASSIRDTYENSIRFVSDHISEYCREMMSKFNRALTSQDGLEEKDILDYKNSVEYLEQAQILKEHLGSSLLSPGALTQNIISELHKISITLNEKDLHSPLVKIYLDNLRMLKNSFKKFEIYYDDNRKEFEKRFDELVQTIHQLILNNDFNQVGKTIVHLYESSVSLKSHLGEQVEEKYYEILKYLLRHLESFFEKAEPLLVRIRLSNEEVEIIKNYIEILKSAKENVILHVRVSAYLELFKKKIEVSDEHDSFGRKIKNLNEIYDEFIVKIIKYFDEINQRIKELFDRNGDHALEHVKTLVKDMDALRTIPELESKTAGMYYRTIENIRGYMQQLQKDVEHMLVAIDQQSGITNYRHLARSLSRLKNSEWINEISSGTYDSLMHRITEDLIQYACKLEENFLKIDFSLKYPENVSLAKEIVEKIESLRDLERSVPELEKYRNNIVERFLHTIQTGFDRIQKTFNLQDNDIYIIKQKLNELEEIKREYISFHPACTYLQKQGYSDIDMLNNEIEKLRTQQKLDNEAARTAHCNMDSDLNNLNSIIQKYKSFSASEQDQILFEKVSGIVGSTFQNKNTPAEIYLQGLGYSRIEAVHEQISKTREIHQNKLQRIQKQSTELNITLQRLELIKKQYTSLSATHNSPSAEEISFLRDKGFNTYELLNENIQEKKRIIAEHVSSREPYHFSDRLDISTANNALIYINQCEKVSHDRVRENAIDANGNLQKYIRKYGLFLNQEISEKFNYTRSMNVEGGRFLYSQELEMRLQELSSFSKYYHVFQCIEGAEKIEHWQQQFLDFHRNLSSKMEEYKASNKIKELRDQVMIAQALTCVDRFCVNVFAGNGFGTLYRLYQGEINKECKVAYKTVLDYISKGDYANADIALSDIEDNPLNARDKAQIQHDLQCSLNKLMKDTKTIANWLDGKIEREDNRSQITEIRENIEKIRIAFNKHTIMDLLDNETKANLRAFDNEINEVLSGIILKGLNSIEAFMDAESFSETEQGMENLSRVQRELAGYCTSPSVTKKSEELRERLDRLVTDILERNDFADVNKYSVNPPKDLLAKLKMVASHGSARFTQAYTSMIGKIRQNFNLAIEEVRNASLNERSVKIRSLNYALYFLPEDLQTQFKLQIDELNKLIADEETAHREVLKTSFTNVDEDEHAITKIGLLAEQYKKENMNELLKTLREQCLKKLYAYRTNVQDCLDKQNIQSAIDIVKKLLKYQESVGTSISEMQGICDNVRVLITKSFLLCCDTLGNISLIAHTQIIEKAFDDTLIYLDFSNTSDRRVENFFPDDVLQNAKEAFEKIYKYFKKNSENFQVALEEKNITELCKIILIVKKWQKFLEKINHCSLNHMLVQTLVKDMRNVILYEDMISELEQIANHLKDQLTVELISDETIKFEQKRENFFSNLKNTLRILKEIKSKFKDIFSLSFDVDIIERDIKMKIEKIKTQLLTKASKDELSARDTDEFRIYYNHLLAFEKYGHLEGIDVQQALKQSEDEIIKKVTALRREIISSSLSPEKVSILFIKMKLLAENLSMFDKNINAEIDEALQFYKRKCGSAGIMHLTIELEKEELGSRLISEHASLSGEDWRKRREKMQKQDDLDYVLDGLTGDDIAKDVLRTRYTTFRKQYDQLLMTHLNSLKQNDHTELDLEVLVTESKLLVDTRTQSSNTVCWSRPFRDNIPKLLAYILAVWTLKNVQHYNAMRGINEAQSYLLMPHVGQIIAIFRLLGIGYGKTEKVPMFRIPYKTISDDLANNLVEVGTGEGKSVVLAATACIFALTGVDVNCSCYSEVLSARDKNDFASVFRAFGIEDRIEYGTFNKLCEQFLNEQCNVREKVRDMIVTNKNALVAADNSVRMRPKALLIDEVDVFLSDKYYGGTYTPSVYLKDPSIKALLDAIWQNNTLETLNSVKALPAYQTCAIRYSNWIFLFDEAIKDMIAALKSYQSSTYIVQNDKIVYVEGESIVDNVVRGYDTVWAYYHEHKNGNISQDSLEGNVGILINCGTFSYAEMPHDFAYIGGVTGTLKTLAKAEREILEKVYEIHKSTYMPSVFGSNNRTYNPMNDVRVVKESEYFMEIRGEIDVMRNARRAILVFFESEEKLMNFYHSSELASIKDDAQIVTEKVSVKDRELCIKRATTLDRVTLLTRTFGRGTDFICRNQQLLANGGIHVLQTFFSEELSEEYQIMGRGARQGDRGSYRMILQDKNLEWVLGPSWKEELPKIIGTTLYEALNTSRNNLYESKCGSKAMSIEQCKADHKVSKEFMSALTAGDIRKIKTFLTEQNKGANLVIASSRTVLLMDATGSMSSLLAAAKETVCTMYERASIVLGEVGLANDAFQMQFVVYRDYDCKEEGILQSSAWETKPNNLRNFMTSITAMGGGDYEEAIEIGLWHAAQESEKADGISQVILIGDAPAKDKPAIQRDRQSYGGEVYWRNTKYKKATHYTRELQRLKAQNIPVHAFYLHTGAKINFERIANETSGRCKQLNIHSTHGAELLTNFVTEEILRKTAGNQGNVVVDLYREKYVKTTFIN